MGRINPPPTPETTSLDRNARRLPRTRMERRYTPKLAININNVNITVAGVDDPHINRDRYDTIAGGPLPGSDLAIALTHAPEPRVLSNFSADGYDLAFAGHTHGGQVCWPNGTAIVTNCGIDRERAHGLHRFEHLWLNVSAGLGTSPYAPFRLFCPPEATLLELTAAR